jgi:surface protein
MQDMFLGATAFNQPLDRWNVSSVTIMRNMFYKASSFNQPIGRWDVSHVENMDGMFREASAFNQPIGHWNVSSVKTMEAMFSLATLFNQDLSCWYVNQTVKPSNITFSINSALDQDKWPHWGSIPPSRCSAEPVAQPTSPYPALGGVQNSSVSIIGGVVGSLVAVALIIVCAALFVH